MSDSFMQRLGAAKRAAWWTVVIGAIWMTLTWLMSLCFLANKPDWVLRLWGHGVTWEQAQALILTFFAMFKLILFVMVLLSLWLTLWHRRLKKMGDS